MVNKEKQDKIFRHLPLDLAAFSKPNLPKQKDIIIIDAEPHAGREYGGHDITHNNIRRHMVVMSSNSYNEATKGFVLAMPITTSEKYANNPKYMPILINGSNGTGVKGYIVLWQLQNFDFIARNGKIINTIDDKTFKQLQPYIKSMLS